MATSGSSAQIESVAAAQALAAEICGLSEQIERERRLPLALVDQLAAAGLFRLCVPRSLGGLELDPTALVATIEALAHSDASVGWCVMIGATSGLLSAYMPTSVAREIYRSETISGGVFAPSGKAIAVDGGYRVSGRWQFASGCQHCSWLMGGCLVMIHGKPQLLASGMPEIRLMLVPAAEVEIIDTWDVSGLRGTGSHDIVFHDCLVPSERAVSLISDRPQQDGALYRFPAFGLLALGIAAVALGIARRAIDELGQLATVKTPSGSRRRLSERPTVQAEVARAEASVGAARSFLFQQIEAVWGSAAAGRDLTVPERAQLRLAATHVTIAAADSVDRMYDAGGGSAVYSKSPLQRCFRDVHVATQHMMVAPATLELVGRVLLGVETDVGQL